MILYTSLKRIFGVEELEEDEAAAAVAMTVDLSAMNTLIATTPMSCDETSGKMVYFRGTGILHSTLIIIMKNINVAMSYYYLFHSRERPLLEPKVKQK